MKIVKIIMTRLVPISVLVLVLGFPAGADDDFQTWMQEQTSSFTTYKDERDREFVGFLKKQWEAFEVSKGLVRDEVPKPVDMPVAPVQPAGKILPYGKKIKIPSAAPAAVPEIKKPVVTRPPPDILSMKVRLDLSFYKTPISIYVDPGFKVKRAEAVTRETIAAFWDRMSQNEYELFISQALAYKKQLKLNDWGYHQLLYEAGRKVHGGSRPMAGLFVWFMSLKTGYESRLGYKNNRVYLLYPSQSKLYSIPYLTFSGKRYYALTFNEAPEHFKSLFTHKGKYPEADKSMDYGMRQSPELNLTPMQRQLDFTYRGKPHSISIEFNRNLIDFFEFYPLTDIRLYFSAEISMETERSIMSEFKPLLDGKSETEAVDMLLRVVQTGFKYKTDDNQFNRENYLLPEETLFYPYSDCEDRSFIFAYLVKRLVGLDVIGIGYPGHVATAVRFSSEVSGDHVIVGKKRFTICDPTYINAGAGMTMPQFRGVEPEVISKAYP